MMFFEKPPKEKAEEQIFIDDVNELVRKSYPSHEGQHPLFKKFGTRTGGIYDTWLFKSNWESLSELEKWKYVALCSLYWEDQYRYWLERKEYEEYKDYLREKGHKKPALLKTLEYLENMED